MATDLELLILRLDARFAAYENALKRAEGITDRTTRRMAQQLDRTQRQINAAAGRFGSALVPSLTAIGAALSVREIIAYGDAWTLAANKIAAAGAATRADVEKTRQDLADLAVSTRASLNETVNIFSRLKASTRLADQELLRITETINKAFTVGGAQTSERIAGVLQLTQGIASGILQGDELRSVRENATVLARAIAEELGVTIGQLKELGAQGKITTDVLIRAFQRAAPEVDRAFAKTQITVGQSLTNLETRFTEFVGKLADSGALAAVAETVNLVANNLDNLAKAVVVVAALLAPAGLSAAAGTAAVAFGVLSKVISNNPLGAIASVLVAVSTAVALYAVPANRATQAQKDFNDALEIATRVGADAAEASKDISRARAEEAIQTLKAARAEDELTLARLRAEAADVAERNVQRRESTDTGGFLGPLGAREALNAGDAVFSERVTDLEKRVAVANEAIAAAEANLGQLKTNAGQIPSASGGDGKLNAFARAVDRIEEQTQALRDQASAGQRTTFELERLEARSRLLAAAQDEGLRITPALTDQIDGLAEAYGRAAAGLDQARAFESAQDRLAGLALEAQQLGLTAAAAERLRFEEELRAELLRSGLPLNAAQIQAISQLGAAYGELVQQIETYRAVNEAAKTIAADLARDLLDVARNLGDGWENALKRLSDSITDLIYERLVIEPFRQWVDGVLSELQRMNSSGSSLLAALSDILASAIGGSIGGGLKSGTKTGIKVSKGHVGLVAGMRPSQTATVDPAVFAGAPRFHAGGVVGLAKGEVPAILRRGEVVFTPEQMRVLGRMIGGGGPTVINNFVMKNRPEGPGFRASRSQLASDVSRSMRMVR